MDAGEPLARELDAPPALSPITHGLLSWTLGERWLPQDRDVALVALVGLAPDLDSLGVVCDLSNAWLGRPATDLYGTLHHWVMHGAAAGLLLSGLAAAAAQDKVRVGWLALVAFHLHLLADVVGSRGPDPSEGIWPVYYWGPFTDQAGVWVWSGQWALNGWQNVSLTIALLMWVFYLAWSRGRSPLAPWAPKAHRALVAALRQRFGPPVEKTPDDRGKR